MLRLGLEYRRPCAVVVLLQTLLVALSLSTLGLTGLGIDYLSSVVVSDSRSPQWPGGWQPPANWSPLTVVVALSVTILVVAVVTAALKYLAAVAGAALSQSILIRLRTDVYAKLLQLSCHYYDAGETSSIINRAAGDANNVRNFIDGVVIRVLTVLLTLAVYLTYMLRMHVGLTLACLATTPLLWVGAVVFSRLVQPAYRRAGELGDSLIRTLVESLQGMQVVKGFAREQDQAERFAAANNRIHDVKNSIFFRVSTFQPAMGLLTQANMLVVIGYGGTLVVRGELPLGSGLFVFASLVHEFANQVAHVTNVANSIQASLISAERVFEVLDEPVRIVSRADARPCAGVRQSIRFEDVTFAYHPGRPVLQNVSLQIAAGERIGLTGPTGSGKSTLLALLMRFYDVSSGAIRIDGSDLRELRLDDLRRNAGLAFQDSFLFSNTVAANIAFADPEADPARVVEAATVAAADGFVSELPDGYDNMVGEHGSNLSGGQRQRLALARAVLRNPRLLLLDDATAAVDAETEQEIHAALESVMVGRTTILVSNRLSALRAMDRVIVLEDGQVTAFGTPDELLATSDYFRELARLQEAADVAR
jgi:ATP-binding cassette subfamily B protein